MELKTWIGGSEIDDFVPVAKVSDRPCPSAGKSGSGLQGIAKYRLEVPIGQVHGLNEVGKYRALGGIPS